MKINSHVRYKCMLYYFYYTLNLYMLIPISPISVYCMMIGSVGGREQLDHQVDMDENVDTM